MKNFFKKLSFVLAVAMVLTSITPATASAAAKNYIYKSGKDAAVESVNVWFGDKATDLNVKINGKKNVAGTWKVGNAKIATVDKNGVITPVANGTTTVKFTAKTGEVVKAQVVVGARVKTVKPYLADDAEKAEVKTLKMAIGDEQKVYVGLGVSATAKAAGATKTSMKTGVVVDGDAVTVTRDSNQKFTVKAVAAGEATITIGAHKSTALVEAGKFFKEAKITVTVADTLAAKQTGANKITVTGTDLSEKVADYSLKLGSASKSLAKVVSINEAKTEVVLETAASYIADGTYTLTFGEKSVEVVCEAAKVASIEVSPKNAIMVTSRSAVAYYKVLNQFGEDITDKSGDLTITGTDVQPTSGKGKIDFAAQSSNSYNMNLSQVSVSIVDRSSAVICTEVLTVTEEARLTSVTYHGIWSTDGGTFKKASLGDGLNNTAVSGRYFILVTGVDQYGITYPADKIAQSNLSMTLSSVTGLQATVPVFSAGSTSHADTVEIDGVEYTKIALSVSNPSNGNNLKSGEVNVLGVVLTSGQQIKDSFTVGAARKIAKLSVSASDAIYGNKTAVLSYEAFDADGEPITDIDTLCRLNNTPEFTSSKLAFVGSKGGNAVLLYQTPSTSNTMTQTIAWITETNEYGYQILTVRPNRFAAAVIGVWTHDETNYGNGVYLAATSGQSISISADDLKYEDQYGNLISRSDFGSVVSGSSLRIETVTEASINASFKAVTQGAVVSNASLTSSAAIVEYEVTPGAVTATTKVTVKASNTDPATSAKYNSEYHFYLAAVDMDDTSSSASFAGGKNNFYVTTSDIDISGNVLVATRYGSALVKTDSDDYDIAYATASALNAALVGVNATGKGEATVVISDSRGTIKTVPFTTGNETPKTVWAGIYDWAARDNSFAANGYATVSSNSAIGGTATGAAVYVGSSTQYANASVSDRLSPRVTISGLPSDTSLYTLTNNGKTDCRLAFTAKGWYTIKVKYSWNDGFEYEETMCFQVTD